MVDSGTVAGFLELSKNAKRDMTGKTRVKIAVLGDCSTQYLSEAICGYAYGQNYFFEIFDPGYDQIAPQILIDQSELYRFSPHSILLFFSTERLYMDFCGIPLELRASFAESALKRIVSFWESIEKHTEANIIQPLFLEMNDGVFGSYGLCCEAAFSFQVRKLNFLLLQEQRKHANVFFFDPGEIRSSLGADVFDDKKQFFMAKNPVSLQALPLLAKAIVDCVLAMLGKGKKCVICDLDNTIWGGVVGDDGLGGLELGDYGVGAAFSSLQQWLKELQNRGVLLAICSKNDESVAKEPFLKHPDMILRLDDIAMFVANWNDKATNIRQIQRALNIGMDSIVFLDDSPFEREYVRAQIPEITVPDLPDDPVTYLPYLQKLNLFESASYSNEDQNRTAQYQAEAARVESEKDSSSYDGYLQNLKMKGHAASFAPLYYPRIAQLSQRSNQFNLRTIRYTEQQIANIAENPDYMTACFTLRDKFGNYGMVSVVIMEKRADQTLFILEWFMSCRVLNRGLEEFVINHLFSEARRHGYKTIVGEYIETNKNHQVKDVYARLGFNQIGENLFSADVEQFKERLTYIEGE